MNPAEKLCLVASGLFLMTGLVTGTWKYLSIRASPQHRAHRYVSVAHQASLAYAFACLVLARLAAFSPYSDGFTLFAAACAIYHFAFAIVAYVIHGLARDTDNQFRPPFSLGPVPMPGWLVSASMVTLVVSEFFGAGLLFWGFLQTQVFSA